MGDRERARQVGGHDNRFRFGWLSTILQTRTGEILMGFWHTGYMDFHQPTGLGDNYPPPKTVYRCQFCNQEFSAAEDLRTHRFESHPFSRPVLIIRGMELGNTPLRISRRLAPDETEALKCDRATLNGEPVSVKSLGGRLSNLKSGPSTVMLSNSGATAIFELQVSVASEADILGVEDSFLRVARCGRLDKRSIEDFISTARAFPSASDYYDGICQYFYGVLAKERTGDSSLPYDIYRDKFNIAADQLRDYQRPLANVIGALIDFHFNHFPEAKALFPHFRVGVAGQRFNTWITGETATEQAITTATFDDQLEKLVTDIHTERLVQWTVSNSALILRDAEYIDDLIRNDFPEFDRTKAHILLAESYAENGDHAKARPHALELRNNHSLYGWAEKILSRAPRSN